MVVTTLLTSCPSFRLLYTNTSQVLTFSFLLKPHCQETEWTYSAQLGRMYAFLKVKNRLALYEGKVDDPPCNVIWDISWTSTVTPLHTLIAAIEK